MNKKLLTPLFLAASFLIVGCSTDEIVARPSWFDDPIVSGDLKDNKLKEIYDAVKELGDTNANILNKVMYDIAKKQIGSFVEIEKFKAESGVDAAEFKKFVDAHPIYKADEKGGILVDNKPQVVSLTAEEKNEVSRIKIEQQYNDIVDRIFEKLFNDIKDGSYNSDATLKLFSEPEYIHHLEKELYDPDTTGYSPVELNAGKKVFIRKPSGWGWKQYVNYDPASTTDNGFLHVMTGENKFTPIYAKEVLDKDDNLIDYDGYIGRKILPEIYRELLIETYVREQRYTNLGRSYARKVEMLTIPQGGSYSTNVSSMLTYYVKSSITDGPESASTLTYRPLDNLTEAMIGIVGHAQTPTPFSPQDYLEHGGFIKQTINNSGEILQWYPHVDTDGNTVEDPQPTNATYVYKGTKLGEIVEKFLKAYSISGSAQGPGYGDFGNFSYTPKVPFDDDAKAAYNDLTNNGVYPIEVGIEIKEREALLTDMTQDGWFLKDGGITELEEKSRNRLFNISTAKLIDSVTYETYKPGDYVRYFEETPNNAFLIKEAISEDYRWESVILNDDNNYFIVRVDEAASSSKLSYDSDIDSYLGKKAAADRAHITDSNRAMNDIVRNVNRKVASSDTYKKNAEQYYLMISNVIFYDESVYNYFKSQFPELFK